MFTEETELIDLLIGLPQSENPYLVSIAYLRKAATPTKLDPWAFYLLIVMIFGYFIAVTLSIPESGPKALNLFGARTVDCCVWMFPPLVGLVSRYTLPVQVELGQRDFSSKLPLMGCKFSVLLSCSWCFLWVCVCQCIATHWEVSWMEAVQERKRVQFPASLRWMLNTFFICIMFGPIVLFTWSFEMASINLIRLDTIAEAVCNSLQQAAPTYNPASYKLANVLNMLLPARKMIYHMDQIRKFVRFALWLGIVDLSLLGIIYVPMMSITLREIYKRTNEVRFAIFSAAADQSIHFRQMQNRLLRERRSIFQHAIAAYFTTIMFIPILCWQVALLHGDFAHSKTWWTGTQLGLHGPFVISGNIVVMILNIQARRHLRAYLEDQTSCRATCDGSENGNDFCGDHTQDQKTKGCGNYLRSKLGIKLQLKIYNQDAK